MAMNLGRWPLATMLAALGAAGACVSNPWSKTFEPTAPPQAARAAAAPVNVREVPWQRMDATLVDLNNRLAASDAPLDEWPVSERDRLKADLLRGLQVTAPPERVDILGRSSFRTASFARPDPVQMEQAAREVGATHVVWSGRFVGVADTVVTEPVQTFRFGSWYGDGWGRHDGFGYSPGIAYVPVVVSADQYGFVAYFLRID